MEKEELESYLKAGRIAAEALEFGRGLIVKGSSLLEVTEKIEEKIKKRGGGLAFPVQIACDEIATHFCAEEDCGIVFGDQLVCLDVGVEVKGFIGDNACTVDLSGKYGDLVKASREALEKALKVVGVGVSLGEIGKMIEEVIRGYGFNPVRNLSGHGLAKFDVHCKPTVPNIDTGEKEVLKEGRVVAIEPFASMGEGVVREKGIASVFQLKERRPVRDMITREVLKEIEGYQELPFARRWLVKKFGAGKVNFALRQLKLLDCLREYPPLVDKGVVSQAEKTVIIGERCRVTTR